MNINNNNNNINNNNISLNSTVSGSESTLFLSIVGKKISTSTQSHHSHTHKSDTKQHSKEKEGRIVSCVKYNPFIYLLLLCSLEYYGLIHRLILSHALPLVQSQDNSTERVNPSNAYILYYINNSLFFYFNASIQFLYCVK